MAYPAVNVQTETAGQRVDFQTHPDRYRHWTLSFDGPIATLSMDVREDAGLSQDYKLKLNSYDLGVDVELADAIQRLRFEHPEVRALHVSSAKDRVFCAGMKSNPPTLVPIAAVSAPKPDGPRPSGSRCTRCRSCP